MGRRLLVLDTDSTFIGEHRTALEYNFGAVFLDSPDAVMEILSSGKYAAIMIGADIFGQRGYEICASIRNNPLFSGLKIILIGLKTNRDLARHNKRHGSRADLYLHKPIATNTLVTAIEAFVAARSFALDSVLDVLLEADLDNDSIVAMPSIGHIKESETSLSPEKKLLRIQKIKRELQKQIAEATANITGLETKLQEKNEKLLSLQHEKQWLQDQNAEAVATITGLEAELHAKKTELLKTKQEKQGVLDQNAVAIASIARLEAELQAKTEDLLRIREEKQCLYNQNADATVCIVRLEMELQAKTESLLKVQQENQRLHNQLTETKVNIVGLEAELDSKKAELLIVLQEKKGLQNKKCELEANSADLESKLQGIVTELSMAKQECLEQQRKREELEVGLLAREEELLCAQQEVQRQRTTITVNLEELDERQKNLEVLRLRLQETEHQLQVLDAPYSPVKSADKVLHNRVKEAVSEKKELLQRLEVLTQELTAKNQEAVMLLRAREDSQQHLLYVEEQMHRLEKEFEDRVESERKLLFNRIEELSLSEAMGRKRIRELEKMCNAKHEDLELVFALHNEEIQQMREKYGIKNEHLESDS